MCFIEILVIFLLLRLLYIVVTGNFVNCWKQMDILDWKWIPVIVIAVLMVVFYVSVNCEHHDCTVYGSWVGDGRMVIL
jgi:hypothetical protein